MEHYKLLQTFKKVIHLRCAWRELSDKEEKLLKKNVS